MLKSHPDMRGLITDVVSECEGLPLALITIGRAMRGKTNARQWKEAKRTLEKYPSTFPGMEGGVFSKLIFSYDSLPNPMVKKCFEYGSLYPEDYYIVEEEVIKLWLGEGFIGEYNSMIDALIQGQQVMESLKQACLLETGVMTFTHSRMEESVHMHDVIRDMALWIACEREKKRNKFYVEVACGDSTIAPNGVTNSEKISLWGARIVTESLAGMSFCPDLSTLIIHDTWIEELPGQIVRSVNGLKVLNLLNNEMLRELPMEIGCLINLEYLNIVRTRVRLPRKVSQCKKLRFLIVDDMVIIPTQILSSLYSLQMFEQFHVTKDYTDIESERKSMERYMLQELEGLKHIMDIRLTLYSATGIQILLDSPKLQMCTTRLVVKQVKSLPDMLRYGTEALTKHLERLRVDYCQAPEIKLGKPSLSSNLCEVSFYWCDRIRNLSSLIYVPNLCVLNVCWCKSIEELIGEETRSSNVEHSQPFSRLTSLTLEFSEKLRSICPQSALPFPSLKFMRVDKCGSLRKLPLDSNTLNTVPQELNIVGERQWWDELEWDSQTTKDAFTSNFFHQQ